MVLNSDIIQPIPMILFFLYAEIHYRIFNLFSRYYRREPEIVADLPHRLGPGQSLPVLIIFKDADRYPITLKSIHIEIAGDKEPITLRNIDVKEEIKSSFWFKWYHLDLGDYRGRTVKINVKITYLRNGKTRQCVNDNYRLTSHDPFTIHIDSFQRPRENNWHFGDLHTHSDLSNDQVEFGAPLEAGRIMSRALELDFFAVTDHSYDLDDFADDYLKNDPKCAKWRRLWQTVERLNAEPSDKVIIPGEEVSTGNSKQQNVHFLVLNNRSFFAGSGDSAERWLQTKPEQSIKEILAALEPEALSFAAHPDSKPPLLQRLLIRRGVWKPEDYRITGLDGVQVWNGDKAHFLNHGIKTWVQLLLDGQKLSLIAGSDAHGNFNRFRQIGVPHISMRESHGHIFGLPVNGVYIEEQLTLHSLVKALRQRRIIVTDGPFAAFTFENEKGVARIGDVFSSHSGTLHITAKSTPATGKLESLHIIFGDIPSKKETQRQIDLPLGSLAFSTNLVVQDLPRPGYIRLELSSRSEGGHFHCFTNPIFLD